MSNYEDAITEVYRLLEDLSKKITRNRNEADELLQEVIIQILEKDKQQIMSIHRENKLIDYCAKIMLINYNSRYLAQWAELSLQNSQLKKQVKALTENVQL